MSQSFISYRQFEHKVARSVHAADHFNYYKHLLPSIPWHHRQRFLDTLDCGCDIPASFDILLSSQKLPAIRYLRFVQYVKKHQSEPAPQTI